MNPEERRLSELLHRVAPEPPRRVTVEDVAFRMANTAGQSRARSPRSRPGGLRLLSRGWAPALAAASVVVVAGLSAGAAVVLTSHHNPTTRGIGSPASPTTSAPATSAVSPTQSTTPASTAKSPVAIPNGPWAAELLNGGHQTLTQGSLVGSGDSLYAYTSGYLVRLDPATGRVLAQTPFSSAVPNPPVIVGNTVWTVLGYNGGNVTLRGFDATTLAQVRTVQVPAIGQVSADAQGPLASSPDGRLYVAAGITVAVVDPSSGQVIRRFDLTAGTASSVAVSPDGSTLYIGVGSFKLLVYDIGSGTERGSSTMSIGGSGGNLVATSGGVWGTIGVGMSEWVWFAPDGDLRFAHRESTGAGAGFDSLPSYSGGVVWIGGSHTVECANPANGQALATATIPADNGVVEYFGSPTVTDGHAYADYQDNRSQQMGLARMTPPAACGQTQPQGS